MLLPSLILDISIGSGSKLSAFLPAPASVINVALAFSFFATVQPSWNSYFSNGQRNPAIFAMNNIGDLWSSTKPKETIAPTRTIKPPPTPTLQYQPDTTASVFYAIGLCIVFILAGAVFTILRNSNVSSPSSVNGESCDNSSSSVDGDVPEDFGAGSNETPVAPNDDPVNPSNSNAESQSIPRNDSSELSGDIGGSPPPPPPSFTTSVDDDPKKPAGFWEKFKIFLIILFFLITLTHGGRITRKIRSFAIRDDFILAFNNTSVTPSFRQALKIVTTMTSHFDSIPATFMAGNTLVPELIKTLTPSGSIPSAIRQVKYNEIPSTRLSKTLSPSISSSHYSSGSNEQYDSPSFPLPTKDIMSYIRTVGLSPATGTPTTPSPSKAALVVEYIKLLTFSIFCILVPILSFTITILPSLIEFVRIWKSISAERETCPHPVDDNAIEFDVDVNAVVLENDKVDINLIHDKVVPASMFIDKGKGKALEAIEEKDEDETTPGSFSFKESLDPATPTLSADTLADRPASGRPLGRKPRPPRRVRMENKRRRKADQAAMEAALNAPFI